MAEGVSRVSGVLDSADVRSTIDAVQALGARVTLGAQPDGSLAGEIEGWGERGPQAPAGPIDCGNSGTTARLLMGLLAGWPVTVTLNGDASLSLRPMRRVTEPLTAMGARFDTTETGTLPVTVQGTSTLAPLAYTSPVASAQVKTALLLAGLRSAGGVRVTEPAASRDHTERLLPAFGIPVIVDPVAHSAAVHGPVIPHATEFVVPRDPSSAAFVVSAALLVPGSHVELPGVSLNETRLGFLRVLERMGGLIEVASGSTAGAEPTGTLSVSYTPDLRATVIVEQEVPSLVDEVPVLALVAARAQGITRFEGVGELRVKESDRLAAVEQGLAALGARVSAGTDWLEVQGPTRLTGASLDSLHDHRLAMVWALAGLISTGPVTVLGYEAVDVSYPRFAEDIALLAHRK
jgi:3-phosphoshikimate 1-carboxyvinyltransferase